MGLKNLAKKVLLSLGVCMLAVNTASVAFAKADTDSSSYLKKEIAAKSNYEFDEFLVQYIRNARSESKSVAQIKSDLAKAGIEFEASQESKISPLAVTYPSDIALKSYSAKRAGESFYRLYGEVYNGRTMYDCGSLDLLSIEWEASKAEYYGYNTENTRESHFTNLFDSTKKSQGIALFNVEDKRMYAPATTWAAVYVTPKVSDDLNFFQNTFIHMRIMA